MDKFFIRFCLQRMEGLLDENFPYECIMDTTAEEVSSFIHECEKWQQKQADNISSSIDLTALYGRKVLFVGDSLTADRLGYRGIVTKAAQIDGYNAAISGAISADMLRYLKDHIQAFNPDIISVMIGTNDSLIIADEKNLVGKEEYGSNIEKIISVGKASGAQVIISTIPPIDEKRFNSPNKANNNLNIDAYCNIIREKAKNGAILNDFAESAKDNSLEQIIENDGVHLTPYGQAFLAKCWLETVLGNIY